MVHRNTVQTALIEHREFMLRVAREVCSEDLAEDAVQEASLRALRFPPRYDDSLLGWLRKVVTNSALQLIRSRERRRYRERAAARPEATPAEAREFSELRTKIMDGIASVRDPYREVLQLRLIDGLSVEQIARQQSQKLETVRSQLHRGKGLLCEDLDRRLGDRREWTASLLVLLTPKSGTHAADKPAQAPAWTSGLVGAAALAAVLGLGSFLVWTESAPEALASSGPENQPEQLASAPLSDPTEDSSRGGVLVPLRSTEVASLTGQCFDQNGQPASFARVFRFAGDLESIPQPMEEHAQSEATADARGDFVLTDVQQGDLIAAVADGELITREIIRIVGAPDRLHPIQLTLQPAKVIEGRVVDQNNKPLSGATVQLYRQSAQAGLDTRPVSASFLAHRDLPISGESNASGEFRLLQPQKDRMRATASLDGHPTCSATAHANKECVLRLAQSAHREIGVHIRGGASPEGVLVEIFTPGAKAPASGKTNALGKCSFESLPNAPYFVARFSRDDLQTLVTLPGNGEYPDVTLRKKRERHGRVVDSSGSGIPGIDVLAFVADTARAAQRVGFSETQARALSLVASATTDSDGVFALPTHDDDFCVIFTGGRKWVPRSEVVSRFDSEFEFQLSNPRETASVYGRVVDSSGDPVESYRVREHELVGLSAIVSPWRQLERTEFAWSSGVNPPHLLEFEAPGFARKFVTFKSLEEHRVVLARARAVRLAFVDANSKPIRNGELVCETPDETPIFALHAGELQQSRIVLDRSGEAYLPEAKLGTWHCFMRHPDFVEPIRFEFSIDESTPSKLVVACAENLIGKRRVQQVILERNSRETSAIAVRTLDQNGAPLAHVSLNWSGDAPQLSIAHPLRGQVREGASPLRWVVNPEFAARHRVRVQRGGSANQATIEVPIPTEEAATLEWRSESGEWQRVELQPDQAHAERIRL